MQLLIHTWQELHFHSTGWTKVHVILHKCYFRKILPIRKYSTYDVTVTPLH